LLTSAFIIVDYSSHSESVIPLYFVHVFLKISLVLCFLFKALSLMSVVQHSCCYPHKALSCRFPLRASVMVKELNSLPLSCWATA